MNLLRDQLIPDMNIGEGGIVKNDGLELDKMYRNGSHLIKTLYMDVVDIYQELMADFDHYGVDIYYETLTRSMGEFFINYDMRFNPQDHLLSLDYPLMVSDKTLRGIKQIDHYSRGITIENQFLAFFDSSYVRKVVRNVSLGNTSDYFGNICEIVLLDTVASIWINRRIGTSALTKESVVELEIEMRDLTIDIIEDRVVSIIKLLLSKMQMEDDMAYFLSKSSEFSARLYRSSRNGSLGAVFGFAEEFDTII